MALDILFYLKARDSGSIDNAARESNLYAELIHDT